jgi:hypothetical protein
LPLPAGPPAADQQPVPEVELAQLDPRRARTADAIKGNVRRLGDDETRAGALDIIRDDRIRRLAPLDVGARPPEGAITIRLGSSSEPTLKGEAVGERAARAFASAGASPPLVATP